MRTSCKSMASRRIISSFVRLWALTTPGIREQQRGKIRDCRPYPLERGVECLNLDFRQHVAAIGRRVNTLCKHEVKLRYPLALCHVYHNCELPHVSLPLSLLSAMRSLRGEHSS